MLKGRFPGPFRINSVLALVLAVLPAHRPAPAPVLVAAIDRADRRRPVRAAPRARRERPEPVPWCFRQVARSTLDCGACRLESKE
jgi:hypothetical protein